jgi:hypothetical protein
MALDASIQSKPFKKTDTKEMMPKDTKEITVFYIE